MLAFTSGTQSDLVPLVLSAAHVYWLVSHFMVRYQRISAYHSYWDDIAADNLTACDPTGH